jgi:hypothetical protein
MPRPSRLVLPGLPHHITQRGTYRQKTYFRADDYRLYLEMLKDYSRHHGVGRSPNAHNRAPLLPSREALPPNRGA